MKKTYFIIITFLAALVFSYSCNGNKNDYLDATDALTRYSEIEQVTFSIAGSAVCRNCALEDLDVTGLQVEVTPKSDPTHTLAMGTYTGLGSFAFSDLVFEAGALLKIYGTIYLGDGTSTMSSWIEVTVPEEDDEVISCVINFPLSAPSEGT